MKNNIDINVGDLLISEEMGWFGICKYNSKILKKIIIWWADVGNEKYIGEFSISFLDSKDLKIIKCLSKKKI